MPVAQLKDGTIIGWVIIARSVVPAARRAPPPHRHRTGQVGRASLGHHLGLSRWLIPHLVATGSRPNASESGTRVPCRCELHLSHSSATRCLRLVHRQLLRRHPNLRWRSQPCPILVELVPSVHAAADPVPSLCAPVTVGLEPTICVDTPQLPSSVVPP
jgi:hypothetical protein